MHITFKIAAAALMLGSCLVGTAFAAEPESCKNVRFSDVGWTDGQVTNGSVQTILEALGYTTETKTVSMPVTFASLKNKDLDVFLDTWLPSMTGRALARAAVAALQQHLSVLVCQGRRKGGRTPGACSSSSRGLPLLTVALADSS